MKKIIYIIFTSVIIIVIIGIYFYNSQMTLATYQSPDNNYELIVKREQNLFYSTMPGDGGTSTPVEVILKNANGKVIGTSNSNTDCGVLLFSIHVEWDFENNQVWYGRAKTINLITGKVEC